MISFELFSKKTAESDVARMSSGNAFHADGPACEKARSPNLVSKRGNTT